MVSEFFTRLFDGIGAVATGLGTGLLHVLGLVMLVFGVLAFVVEVVLTRAPALRPRPGLPRNGVTWSPRELLVAAMCAAIYAVTLALTAGLQLVPGFVQARPANALLAVFAVLFGIPGCAGLAVGNILGDVLSGTMTLGSVGGFFGIFTAAYLVHALVGRRRPAGWGYAVRLYLVTFAAALFGTGLLISAWLATIAILPPEAVWTVAFPSIFFVVLYPQWLFSLLLLKALYPAFERRGWLGEQADAPPASGRKARPA